jgi:hypothetical protein
MSDLSLSINFDPADYEALAQLFIRCIRVDP